uniref:Uncharacterized protein n=1 Tax=Cacopsylla melanoneura TaxID=428564 RepID=A0A8D8ZH96_9HEMI
MYGKVVALVVIMAAVALASPMPDPKAAAAANPGYINGYGRYVATNEDYADPASPYYNPYAVGPNNVNPFKPYSDPFNLNPAAFPQGASAYSAYYTGKYY